MRESAQSPWMAWWKSSAGLALPIPQGRIIKATPLHYLRLWHRMRRLPEPPHRGAGRTPGCDREGSATAEIPIVLVEPSTAAALRRTHCVSKPGAPLGAMATDPVNYPEKCHRAPSLLNYNVPFFLLFFFFFTKILSHFQHYSLRGLHRGGFHLGVKIDSEVSINPH